VVELARERQRPERAAGLADAAGVGRRRAVRPAHGDLGEAPPSIEVTRDVAVADPVAVDGALERSQGDAPRPRRPVGAGRELGGAPLHAFDELRGRYHLVHEAPLHGARTLDPLLDRT